MTSSPGAHRHGVRAATATLAGVLIVIVAAFSIMNTLITVTVLKTREIGVMKALGATRLQIVWVFLLQGMAVGVFGNLTGVGVILSSLMAQT